MDVQTLPLLIKNIRDELLLWLLAMLTLAVVAGLRDRVTFIAVLVIGAVLFALRLLLEQRRLDKTDAAHGLPLTLTFTGTDVEDVELSRCRYELFDLANANKGEGELAFSFDVNSWICFLPRGTASTDIIRIYLTDTTGQNWETGPFRPLFGTREAKKAR